MAISTENLRFILGLKLKNMRHARGLSLKVLARTSGMSISYLSEIEKGKKYPKPDKLIALAETLGVSFDDLVSASVDDELNQLTTTLSSPFFSEFPFRLFGLDPQDLLSLFSDDPGRAGALIRTFLEIGQMYDMRVEHFLFAALRSYQLMHDNYFEEIEAAADRVRAEEGDQLLSRDAVGTLERRLMARHGFEIDYSKLARIPELRELRSAYSAGDPPQLYVNDSLLPTQQAFVLGREIGFREMELAERAPTSAGLEVTSFDQVLNGFKASYFAGAVLLPRDEVIDKVKSFFSAARWNADSMRDLLGHFRATPEMFLYRLGQLLPHLLGFDEFFFLRINYDGRTRGTRLSKVFNRSDIALPQGFWLDENYCRRWGGMRLVHAIAEGQKSGETVVHAQRSHFPDGGPSFFVFSLARPLRLVSESYSCVSLAFRINDAFRRQVAFWSDPSVPDETVGVTCERCHLDAASCADRVAPPQLHTDSERVRRKEAALATLLAGSE